MYVSLRMFLRHPHQAVAAAPHICAQRARVDRRFICFGLAHRRGRPDPSGDVTDAAGVAEPATLADVLNQNPPRILAGWHFPRPHFPRGMNPGTPVSTTALNRMRDVIPSLISRTASSGRADTAKFS